MRPFDERRVLLVVSGGIAAYKSAFLVRRLLEAGAAVDVILTASARRFIGEVTFEGLTGRQVHTDLWERPLAHLDLGRAADVIAVAPATAEILSRLSAGGAGDLATATILAADCPVVVCPAMNTRMWEHPATRRNVSALRDVGYAVVEPGEGPLAEGESGPGRMAEPEEIVAHVGRALEPPSPLAGRKIVVTAGPTRAPWDAVRFLANRSSGRMGYALAASAWRRRANVLLVTGPGSAPRPVGPTTIEIETAAEMLEALESELRDADMLLMAAAVGDFEAAGPIDGKLKKEGHETLALELRPGPDLLAETRALRESRRIFTLGFALETGRALELGREKLERKGLDMIAVNDATDPEAGFDVATNRITLIDRAGGVEELPTLLKEEVADRLLDRIEEASGR